LEKLKVVAGYLHQEGIPFHIALIPREIIPSKGYDVSIADQTAYARHFVSAIKYLESIGGIVGIHGYTHQSGSDPSGLGFEFYDRVKNPSVPDSLQYARNRVSASLDLFMKAGITPAFWETPHYTASPKQCQAFEEQIGLIYESNYRNVSFIRPHTIDYQAGEYRGYTIVPTPLGYINTSRDLKKMIDTLDNPEGMLPSFFYHPFKEFKYIHKSYTESGETFYEYDNASPLHQLIRVFKDKGYTFVSIYSLAMFVPAQRGGPIIPGEQTELLAGHFEPGGKGGILLWDRGGKRFKVFRSTVSWYAPRNKNALENRGEWLAGWDPGDDALPMAGDINGDGLDDLIFFSPAQGCFNLAENDHLSFRPLIGETVLTDKEWDVRPLAGDFNGDHLCDLGLVERRPGRLGIALNSGHSFGSFAWQDIGLLKEDCPQKYLPGDYNGDGRADVAVLDTGTGLWRLLLSLNGTLMADERPWLERWGAGSDWQALPADVNGDGKCDIVVHSKDGFWQAATSTGNRLAYRGEFGPWGAGSGTTPRLTDLNGDKKSDLIILDGGKLQGYHLDTALSVIDLKN
jgi:hypothetical protein